MLALGIDSTLCRPDLRIFYTPLQSTKGFNLDHQTSALFVYSDIVDYQIVGDVLAPLLRVVPVTGTRDKINHVEFKHKLWMPVNKGYISSILVMICDDTGDEVKFPAGKVTVVLHFKKRSAI